MNLRKLSAGEAAFQPHQRRPEAPVHKRHLVLDESAHQQIVRI